MTGCFIPQGQPPSAETDGPIGAAALAGALLAADIPVAFVTDRRCVEAVDAAARVVVGTELPVAVIDDEWTPSRGGAAYAWRGARPAVELSAFSHAVAIERLGVAADARVYGMRGDDRTPFNAACDALFRAYGWRTIGIGDGGNEIGMGNVPHDIVAADIEAGERIHCRTTCDDLVVAGCANWGAFGLVAALAVAMPARRASILRFVSPRVHAEALSALVDSAGAIDGLLGVPARSVDGIPEDEHERFIAGLRDLVEGAPA